MLKHLEKEKAWKIGLLQSLLVAVYCGAVATFVNYMAKAIPKDPEIIGMFLVLSLLVFSAAVTGSLVLGYPVYLAIIKNKLQESIKVLAFTLLFSFIFIISTVLFIIGIFG